MYCFLSEQSVIVHPLILIFQKEPFVKPCPLSDVHMYLTPQDFALLRPQVVHCHHLLLPQRSLVAIEAQTESSGLNPCLLHNVDIC
jgi:hypothetical protein